MNYNQVTLMGRVTRDIELKAAGQTQVANFGLAVNHTYKTANGEKKEEVSFVDVTAFGKQAELLAQYIRKGSPLFLTGRLKLDTWEKDGQKHSKLKVVLENFQFIGGKSDGASASPQAAAEEPDDVPGLR